MSQSLAVRSAKDALTIARVREIVEQLAERDRLGEILTAVHHIPAREAKFAPMPEWVRPELVAAYGERGVGELYSHQAAAAAAAREGLNTVVVTPTASGKTLCYNLTVLNAVLENRDTRALYLFPTKALAQDQLAELQNLSALLDHRFGVFTVRRRYTLRRAKADPRAGTYRAHQSRHAAHRHPSAPHTLAALVREFALHSPG